MDNYQIFEFYGIQQQKDGSLLPSGTAFDARNIDTKDGNLSVAAGYEKHINHAIPNTDRLLKAIPVRGASKFYVVGCEHIYASDGGAWTTIYSFSPTLQKRSIDFLQTKIGLDEYVLIATGETQILKVNIDTDSVTLFGSGAVIYESTVASYDAQTLTVTLTDSMSEEQQRRAYVDGLYFGDSWAGVSSYTSTTLTFAETPYVNPKNGDSAKIRGGGSDAHVGFIDKYYSRLWSAGDPNAQGRLYWSAIAGDGRTIEDWLATEAHEDASGGYVEVGDEDGDPIIGIRALSNQIIIFKRYSTWRLYGDRPSTFTVERISPNAEDMANSSVITLYDQPFFLTKNGLQYYNGSAIVPVDGGAPQLMRFLRTVVSVKESKGVVENNRMYFSCRTGAGEYDDSIVQFDILTGSYMVRDGFNIADIAAYDGNVYLLTEKRYLYRFESGMTYDGDSIVAYWQTQPTDLSAKYYKKQIREIIMRADGTALRIIVTADGQNRIVDRLLWAADNDGYFREPLAVDQARRFSIRIENEAGSYFSVQGGFDVRFEKEWK